MDYLCLTIVVHSKFYKMVKKDRQNINFVKLENSHANLKNHKYHHQKHPFFVLFHKIGSISEKQHLLADLYLIIVVNSISYQMTQKVAQTINLLERENSHAVDFHLYGFWA